MWWMMRGFDGGLWWLGGLFMLIFWGGIIALVVWGIIRLSRHSTMTSTRGSPLDLAKERYAKGEITKEQFEQIKKDLS